MTYERKDREIIEHKGIPEILAIIRDILDTDINDIEIVKDKERQFKGIDFIADNINIDSKYHNGVQRKQIITDLGVNAISIELRTRNGAAGWGVSPNKETDLIIDYIPRVAVYLINAYELRSYMRDHLDTYPIWYSYEGQEQYAGVSIADLIAAGVIIDYSTDPSYLEKIKISGKEIKNNMLYGSLSQ